MTALGNSWNAQSSVKYIVLRSCKPSRSVTVVCHVIVSLGGGKMRDTTKRPLCCFPPSHPGDTLNDFNFAGFSLILCIKIRRLIDKINLTRKREKFRHHKLILLWLVAFSNIPVKCFSFFPLKIPYLKKTFHSIHHEFLIISYPETY